MDINTNVYGAPETWYTPSGDYGNKPAIKLPTWGTGYYNHYYFGGFDTGVFSANGAPVDNSLALWGVNKNAPLAQPYFCFPTLAVDSSYVYTTAPEVHILNVLTDENATIPMTAAVYGSNMSTRANSTPDYQYTPNAATPLQWTQAACQPILDFNYNNIVLCPYIIAARDTTGSDDSGLDFTTYSITDYFDGGGQTAYPYIVAVNADIYISTSSTNARSKNNDSLKFWYSKEYASHVSSWQGTFTQYIAPYYSVQPMNTIRISGGYTNAVDSSYNYTFGSNQSFTTISEAFARFSRIGYSVSPHILLNNGNYQFKVVANRGYCTITTIWAGATKDDVLKEVAYLGFWFCDDTTTAINSANGQSCTSDKMHIPLFDDNGITKGEWLSGLAAAAVAPADDDTARTIAPDYDPNAGGGDTPDEDSGDLGNFRNFTDTTHFNYPCTVYALTETNFRNFAEALNALYLTDQDTTQMELDFKGSNPTDYIINCYALPFEPNFLSSSEVGVQIGPQTLLNITGKVVNTATSFYIDCGSKTIPRRGNFLDFEPYTHIELYLPMCGTITLDPALVVGKTIRVVMYYNILTNSATAAVYRLSELGDSLIATSTGEIGISIPFSAYNMGQYQNAIKATENAIKQNGLKVATGVATTAVGIAGALLAPETGGLSLALTGAALAGGSSALSAAMKGGELHYELEHIAPSVSQCSSADGSLAHVIAKTIPWIFIKRARMLQSYDEEVYAKTIGHACCINDILGGSEDNPRTGLTVCSNIDTSGIQKEVSTGVYIAPTVEEINAIKQAAASGIIL